MIERWADTSALLHQHGLVDPVKPIAISPLTLHELEKIKDNDKEKDKVKFLAREAVRSIMTTNKFVIPLSNNKKVDKLLKKYEFLSNINDHRIICEAELTAIEQNKNIIFLTSDALQYIFASQMPHLEAVYPMGTDMMIKIDEEWAGWGKYYPEEKDMALLYADPKINILKCKTNEYAEIYEGTELKDVLTWTGHEYRALKYKEIRNDFLGQTIRPLNIE